MRQVRNGHNLWHDLYFSGAGGRSPFDSLRAGSPSCPRGAGDFENKSNAPKKENDFNLLIDFVGLFFDQSIWELLGDLWKNEIKRAQFGTLRITSITHKSTLFRH